jgi:superfamily I DNA/RNA helicase
LKKILAADAEEKKAEGRIFQGQAVDSVANPVADENRNGHSAKPRISKKPWINPGPLMIVAGPGTGKTHANP